MEIWIPYGDTEVQVVVRAENLVGIAEPKDMDSVNDLHSEIQRAFAGLEGMEPLSQLLGPTDQVRLFTDLPSAASSFDVINSIVHEVSGLVDVENITVLWRHPEGEPLTTTNLESVNGKNVRTIDLDDANTSSVPAKESYRGKEVEMLSEFREANLRILVSRVSFDPIWGYAGGRSILLGLLDKRMRGELRREAVRSYLENGSFEINRKLKQADPLASLAGRTLALNIVTNKDGRVSKIFAGELDEAFNRAAKYVDEVYKIELEKAPDIMIIGPGGRPYDYTLSRSLDSIMLNMSLLKKGGGIVLVAECIGGYGSDNFKEIFSKGQDSKQLKSILKKDFADGAEKAYFLTYLLEDFRVYLISVMPDHYTRGIFHLKTSRTVNDALQSAFRALGKDSSVAVVPYGSITRTFAKPRT